MSNSAPAPQPQQPLDELLTELTLLETHLTTNAVDVAFMKQGRLRVETQLSLLDYDLYSNAVQLDDPRLPEIHSKFGYLLGRLNCDTTIEIYLSQKKIEVDFYRQYPAYFIGFLGSRERLQQLTKVLEDTYWIHLAASTFTRRFA